jgi:hypothetical protein
MTKLAAEAWRQLQELEDTEQDRLARIILDDIESERRWDELFAKCQDMLEEMGEAAWQDHLAGRTTPLNPDLL